MRIEYRRKRFISYAFYILIGLAIILTPLTGDMSIVGMMTRILIFGLLAMSLDLLIGYTGLWSFGHAAFFAIGAYTSAILIVHFGITGFMITAVASILMTAFFASIFGFIALRVSDLYFLLVTFALGELVYNLAIKWNAVTNGEYGLGGIPYPAFADSATSIYYLTLGVVIICSILLYFIIKSPFGYSIQGIRDNELRMKSLGYNVWLYKYIAYIIAGIFAGVAGILYVYYNGIITPYSAGVTTSGLLWLMIIIGGVGTLWGSLLGCTIMLLLEYIVSMLVPERWPLIVGGCLIIAVLFARQGIWSYITKIYARYR